MERALVRSIRCPKCRTPMDVCPLDARTEVDFCPDCKGMWLQKMELASACGKSQDLPDPEYSRQASARTLHPCPDCGDAHRLLRFPFARDCAVQVDGCPKCGGLFLDFKELPAVQERLRKFEGTYAIEAIPAPARFVDPVSRAASPFPRGPAPSETMAAWDRFRSRRFRRALKFGAVPLVFATWIFGLNFSLSGLPNPASRPSEPISVEDDPEQSATSVPMFSKWMRGRTYYFDPVAQYKTAGVVVSTNRHYVTREGLMSPVDIGVIWGKLTAPEKMNEISYWQRGRFLYYGLPDESMVEEVFRYSANNHIIPADDRMYDVAVNIKPGDRVVLEGYLVNVMTKKSMRQGGWIWQSSVSRLDKGAGACEVLYLTRARVNGVQY